MDETQAILNFEGFTDHLESGMEKPLSSEKYTEANPRTFSTYLQEILD